MLQQDETIQRRDKILMSALEAFTEKGIFETTMSDIRRISGASTGSVYHHFNGKQHIAFELYMHGTEAVYNLALEIVREKPGAEEGITSIVKRALRWHDENRKLGYFLFRAADTGFLDEHDEAIRASQVRFLKEFAVWMEPKMASGELRRIPHRLQVPLIIGPTREFLRNWMPECAPQHLQEALEFLPRAAWEVSSGPNAS